MKTPLSLTLVSLEELATGVQSLSSALVEPQRQPLMSPLTGHRVASALASSMMACGRLTLLLNYLVENAAPPQSLRDARLPTSLQQIHEAVVKALAGTRIDLPRLDLGEEVLLHFCFAWDKADRSNALAPRVDDRMWQRSVLALPEIYGCRVVSFRRACLALARPGLALAYALTLEIADAMPADCELLVLTPDHIKCAYSGLWVELEIEELFNPEVQIQLRPDRLSTAKNFGTPSKSHDGVALS